MDRKRIYSKTAMNIVLFDSAEIEEPLPLYDERASHILKILKKNVGDTFEAGIIGAMAGKALIMQINDEGIAFNFTPNSDGKPLYPVSVIIGFPRPIQLKRLFRDMAGLGIAEIHLVGTELGEKSYMDSTIVERGSAYEALKNGSIQAKSTYIPELFVYPSLKNCLETLQKDDSCFCHSSTIKTALDNVRSYCSLNALLSHNYGALDTIRDYMSMEQITNAPRVYAAIGSERGWTDNERSIFEQYKFVLTLMGSRVLRTETAATAAVTIILSQLGML